MKNKSKKVKIVVALTILVLFVSIPLSIALAKFYKSYVGTIEDNRTKIADFYVDITDSDKKPVVNKIGIDNLNPGDTKEVVFYVRNGHTEVMENDGSNNGGATSATPDANEEVNDGGASATPDANEEANDGGTSATPDANIGVNNIRISDVNIDYSISLLHTNNLPLEYKLYSVDKNDVKTEIQSNNSGTENGAESQAPDLGGTNAAEINTPTEIKFGSDSNYLFTLDTKNKDSDGITYDKYILEVKWDKAKNDNGYIKEVDLIYMVVNAVQKEPTKGTE